MKKLILLMTLLIVLIIASSCTTTPDVNTNNPYPTLDAVKPIAPVLENAPASEEIEIPQFMINNLIMLLRYVYDLEYYQQALEVYIEIIMQ